MKKKIIFTLFLVAMLCVALVVSASATYYVDKDGNVATETSENLAYEFDIVKDKQGGYHVYELYLYDTSITTIVLPDFEDITKLYISEWSVCLKIYSIENKGSELTEEMELQKQIKELDIYEHVSMDGANAAYGSFMYWTALEKISFRGAFSYGSKSGIFAFCSSLRELHFYGQNIAVPAFFTNVVKHNLTGKGLIVFHEGSSGTIQTGTDTLPTYGNLNNNFAIIINENITPSNPDDTRLGGKWGSYSTTSGWELILAVSDKNDYTPEQLEALKTSHSFCSRFASVAEATVKEATVKTYCELGYAEHNEDTVYEYANGYASNGTVTVGCTNGCGLETVTELDPIFVLLGYSSSMTSNKACVGYMLNETALNLYKEKTGVTLDYGVVAIIPTNDAEYSPLYVENGEIKGLEYSIYASVANSYASFDFVIAGFSEEYYETELVMCAYVYDGESIGYLCAAQDEQGNMICAQYDKATTVTFKSMLEE